MTDTAAFRAIPHSDELHARLLTVHPGGRITTPQDVAGAVVALCSPARGWLTGNTISVDGGESIIG